MHFNSHSDLNGQHAFLSASKYHWINYSDEKLDAAYISSRAAVVGTRLHEFAAEAIRLGIKLPRNQRTLNAYVNDAIGFRLKPEQILFYSYNAFGTADAISFEKKLLRIHDLKTGTNQTSMSQLDVYAALFCLEYDYKPRDISMELRIYQNDEVSIYNPEAERIEFVMERIVTFDERINRLGIFN